MSMEEFKNGPRMQDDSQNPSSPLEGVVKAGDIKGKRNWSDFFSFRKLLSVGGGGRTSGLDSDLESVVCNDFSDSESVLLVGGDNSYLDPDKGQKKESLVNYSNVRGWLSGLTVRWPRWIKPELPLASVTKLPLVSVTELSSASVTELPLASQTNSSKAEWENFTCDITMEKHIMDLESTLTNGCYLKWIDDGSKLYLEKLLSEDRPSSFDFYDNSGKKNDSIFLNEAKDSVLKVVLHKFFDKSFDDYLDLQELKDVEDYNPDLSIGDISTSGGESDNTLNEVDKNKLLDDNITDVILLVEKFMPIVCTDDGRFNFSGDPKKMFFEIMDDWVLDKLGLVSDSNPYELNEKYINRVVNFKRRLVVAYLGEKSREDLDEDLDDDSDDDLGGRDKVMQNNLDRYIKEMMNEK